MECTLWANMGTRAGRHGASQRLAVKRVALSEEAQCGHGVRGDGRPRGGMGWQWRGLTGIHVDDDEWARRCTWSRSS